MALQNKYDCKTKNTSVVMDVKEQVWMPNVKYLGPLLNTSYVWQNKNT